MPDTITFIQGSSTLDLDDGTAYETKEINLSTPSPDALMHLPDYGENKVVRIEDKDREATLQMRIVGDEWDDIHNNIAEIRRWLKEAARAEIDGDADTVYLQLKRGTTGSTATNATNSQIRWGWLDGDSSVWTGWGEKKEQAIVIFVHMILTPYGEAASTISLSNDLFNSAHFIETSAVAGLAAGWNKDGAAPGPTLSLDITEWLIGGQSQQIDVTADAETQGIRSDSVTAGVGDDVVAYIWIAANAANLDTVQIDIENGANGVEETVTFDPSSPAGYDKSISDPAGGTKTWYRYSLISTAVRAAVDVQIRVARRAGDANIIGSYFIDGAYLEVGASSVPNAWMSSRNIDNRNDYLTTSQATENYLNYIDIWGVLGDAEPLVDMYLDLGTGGTSYTVVSQVYDGEYLATEKPSHIEAEDLATKDITDGAFATPGDAARSAADYIRFTASATYGSGTFYHTLPGANAPAFTSSSLRVIAICRSDDTGATIRMTTGNILVPENAAVSEARSVQTAATWEAIDLGSIDATHTYDKDVTYASGFTVNFIIENVTDTKVFECDVVHYMPVDDGFSYMPTGTAGVQPDVVIYGTKKKVTSTTNPGVRPNGTIWTCAAGNTTSRRYVAVFETDGAHDLTDATPVNLVITPRTRHLLGTA